MIQTIRVGVSDMINILEHPLFLSRQTILVNVAGVTAHMTARVAAVHGMMLGKPVRLYGNLVTTCQPMLTGDLQLPGDSVVILEAPPTVQILC
jgi:hypothetical protein